jgi:ribonuclease HII
VPRATVSRATVCSLRHENRLRSLGFAALAGVDEAGRGCIFGPVCAAAVILKHSAKLTGIRDSKLVPEEERPALAEQVRAQSVAWSVAFASVDEIERINILQASRLAMRRAVEGLSVQPDYLLVDFLRVDVDLPQEGLVKGDAKSKSIAAASILAKTSRDAVMAELHREFPVYGLASNKGYGTPDHLAALRAHGVTRLHRAGFAPVRELAQPGLFRV